MRFRNTMQQKQWRTVAVATVNGVDRRARNLDLLSLKPFEKFRVQGVGFSLCMRTVLIALHLNCSLIVVIVISSALAYRRRMIRLTL